MNFRRTIDLLMTIALMLLMSKQITEQSGHEYIGIIMFVLFIIHQYLNRRWYTALFKGKYNANRILSTTINLSLLISFIMTAFSGILISENFPELNIEALTSYARTIHLCCSYLSFVLMGLHLGLHWGMIALKIKSNFLGITACIFSGWGLYVFMSARLYKYIFLITEFAFIDYEKNSLLALTENIAMLSFFTLIGFQTSKLLTGKYIRPVMNTLLSFGVFVIIYLCFGFPEAF